VIKVSRKLVNEVKWLYVIVRALVVESVLWLVNGMLWEVGREVWEVDEGREVLEQRVNRAECSTIETMVREGRCSSYCRLVLLRTCSRLGARSKLKHGVDLATGMSSREE